jgi:septum formation protein
MPPVSLPELFLASTSPRRAALLTAAGVSFALCTPGPEYAVGDEHEAECGEPAQLAIERARRKGEFASIIDPQVPILAVDTVVDLDGEELGKPRDLAAAEAMLRRLAARSHRVHTAHYLRLPATGQALGRLDSATVACGPLAPRALAAYLASGQWRGKAGSYGVQDDAQSFFRLLDGAFDTVVGLHVPAVLELLLALRGNA